MLAKQQAMRINCFTSEDSGGHDLLSQDFEIFYNKVNSCLVKTPNIRGNKTTNEEVKYVCCLKQFLQLEISKKYRTQINENEACTYVYLHGCL